MVASMVARSSRLTPAVSRARSVARYSERRPRVIAAQRAGHLVHEHLREAEMDAPRTGLSRLANAIWPAMPSP